jgi:hypothetical protein
MRETVVAWRFNAPPGWPVPPDFVPPQGWVPDPAWPPAPAGWTYWVEAPAPGPWGDPYLAAAPIYGAAPGYGVPPGYAGGPGDGAPAPKRGLPGWVIGLIAAGVAFAVLSVVGLLVAGGLVFASLSNGGIQDAISSSAAADACDQATSALGGTGGNPDPARATRQARALEDALEAAEAANLFDDTYEALRDDIADARLAANRIAALPADPATWTQAQRQLATEAQAELDELSSSISRTCSTIEAPFEDNSTGPTV